MPPDTFFSRNQFHEILPNIVNECVSGYVCFFQPQDYLSTLEQNIFGLVNHLEQTSRKVTSTEKIGHWFRAISDAEPAESATYLKTAAGDLSRTCEAIEGHHNDLDDGLLVQNLHSIAEYVRAAEVCVCV